MNSIRVGVFDDHEIFAQGVEAILREDDVVAVVVRDVAEAASVDVAVVSLSVVGSPGLDCPLVACVPLSDIGAGSQRVRNVFAELARETVTPNQLCSAVRAAASGLRIERRATVPGMLADRERTVLRLLANGADTREIAAGLGYSERTIKGAIQQIEQSLGARSRAHAVALALRSSLI